MYEAIIIGARCAGSPTALLPSAPEYNTKPPLEGSYPYWSGVKLDSRHQWIRRNRMILGFPTNENLTLIGVAFAACDPALARQDTERQYLQSVAEHAPVLRKLMRDGRREALLRAQSRSTCANRMARAGHWWETPGLVPRPELPVHLAAPSCRLKPWISDSAGVSP